MLNDPAYFLNEGMRLLQAGDFTSALAALQSAVQQNPQDGRAYGYLGIAYARLGDLNASVYALQEAARLQPQDSNAQYNLAVGLMQAQRAGEARTALEQALRLNPGNQRAQAALQSVATAPAPPAPYAPPAAPVPQQTLYAPQMPAPPAPYGYAPNTPPGGYASNAPPAPMPPNQPAMMPLNGGSMPPPAPNYANYTVPTMQTPPYAAQPPAGYAPGYAPGYGPGGTPAPGMGGMQYAPKPFRQTGLPPAAGTRVLRGLGWGALFGQWWTLWVVFWDLIAHSSGERDTGLMIFVALVLGVFFAVVGSVMGLIIGMIDAMEDVGAIVGVVFGVLMLALEYSITRNSMIFVNILFWSFTGRFIGRNIALRVQQF